MNIARFLLDRCINFDNQDKRGRTPLLWTCESGYGEIVTLLLEKFKKRNRADNELQMVESAYDDLDFRIHKDDWYKFRNYIKKLKIHHYDNDNSMIAKHAYTV